MLIYLSDGVASVDPTKDMAICKIDGVTLYLAKDYNERIIYAVSDKSPHWAKLVAYLSDLQA